MWCFESCKRCSAHPHHQKMPRACASHDCNKSVKSGHEHSMLDEEELNMADKSPKKSTPKTAASKSLKEKRAEKKDKAATKRND